MCGIMIKTEMGFCGERQGCRDMGGVLSNTCKVTGLFVRMGGSSLTLIGHS